MYVRVEQGTADANRFSMKLLVNERFGAAQRFYKKAGFKIVSYYDTIFLKADRPN